MSPFLGPYRLGVRTAAFQAVNPGSNPGRVTKAKNPALLQDFLHLVKEIVTSYRVYLWAKLDVLRNVEN